MTSENDELQEIINDFIVESEETIEKLDQDLLKLEKESDPDLLNNVFRGFHTIKGTSGFLGYQVVSTLTHQVESLLNLLRKGEIKVSPKIVDALLASLDILRHLISCIKDEGKEEAPDNLDEIIVESMQLIMPLAQKRGIEISLNQDGVGVSFEQVLLQHLNITMITFLTTIELRKLCFLNMSKDQHMKNNNLSYRILKKIS